MLLRYTSILAKLHHAILCMKIPYYRSVAADDMTTLSRFAKELGKLASQTAVFK